MFVFLYLSPIAQEMCNFLYSAAEIGISTLQTITYQLDQRTVSEIRSRHTFLSSENVYNFPNPTVQQ